MAEIPVFEGGSEGAPADVRVSRIGPEDPAPTALEKMGQEGHELMSMFQAMDRQNQFSLVDQSRSQAQDTLWQAGQANQATPWTNPKDYMSRVTSLNDDAIQAGLAKQGANKNTLARAHDIWQSEHDSWSRTQAMWAASQNSQHVLANIRDGLQSNAQNEALATDPAQKARIHDNFETRLTQAMTPDTANNFPAAINAKEAEVMRKQHSQSVATYTGMDWISKDPADALSHLDDPAWVAKNDVYSNLTPTQHNTLVNEANKAINKQLNEPTIAYKQQLLSANREWDQEAQHSPGGVPSIAWATDQVHHYPDLEKRFEATFGRKAIPAEGDPAFQASAIGMLSQATTPEEVKQQSAAYYSHYGTAGNQHTEYQHYVDLRTEQLGTGRKQQIDQWTASNGDAQLAWTKDPTHQVDLTTAGDPSNRAFTAAQTKMRRDAAPMFADPNFDEGQYKQWRDKYMAPGGTFEQTYKTYGGATGVSLADQYLAQQKKAEQQNSMPASGPIGAILKFFNTPENK